MATKKESPSRYVTARTFARAVGIAEVTAWRWIANGRLRSEVVGPVRYILATEIDRFLSEVQTAKRRNAPGKRRQK